MASAPFGIVASANLKRDADLHMKKSLFVIFENGATEKKRADFFTSSLNSTEDFNGALANSLTNNLDNRHSLKVTNSLDLKLTARI